MLYCSLARTTGVVLVQEFVVVPQVASVITFRAVAVVYFGVTEVLVAILIVES